MPKSLRTSKHEKAATLSDVARLAGTAKGTASRALNGRHWVAPQTRQSVLRAAKELGFRADPTAQSLASGHRSTLVGLFTHSLDLGVSTLKLQLLQNALNEKGFDAPIHACGSVPRGGAAKNEQLQAQAIAGLCRQRPAAIICYTFNLKDAALQQLQRYCDAGGAVVCYDTPIDLKSERTDYVVFDRDDNTYQATRHLLELGHRRIGLFSGGTHHSAERRRGFRRALREFQLAPEAEFSFLGARYESGPGVLPAEELGQKFGEEFVSLASRPSAVCITDDHVAAGFIAAVMRGGLRVPEDVSVVGQDDLPIAAFACAVPLTTVSQPIQAITRECVAFTESRLKGDYAGPPRRSTLRGELVVRQSAAHFKNNLKTKPAK
jgi:DNA-binding LacI/PurR family transcriptional regulator